LADIAEFAEFAEFVEYGACFLTRGSDGRDEKPASLPAGSSD
jgi:hypothetical protein